MSDREDGDYQQSQEPLLRRKRPRACDECRRRKVKCDGLEDNGKTCSNCITFKEKCTYAPTKKRNADEEYIKQLEAELVRLQFLVQQLQNKLYEKDKASSASSPSASQSPRSTPPSVDGSSKREDNEAESLLTGFKFMSLNDSRHVHYMGRSSYMALFNTAMAMKREASADGDTPLPCTDRGLMMLSRLRPQFWTNLPDNMLPDPPYTNFPEPVLLSELLENYFRDVHDNFPLLHRPTLIRGIAAGLHYSSEGFGAIVLLICAIGARFSTNPAVLPPGSTTWHRAGFRYYDQVQTVRKLMPRSKATLYDLQVVALAGAFISTLGLPYSNFAIVGYGLRIAQDLGAHRRATYSPTRTVEDELLLRAFWCLIALDRSMSTTLGRSCDLQDENFDVDFPTECDDEYWIAENPKDAFKQPVGKPSTVSHFVWHLKLFRINAHTLRTIYSLQGDRILEDQEQAQQIIADLDSELNSWVEELPLHLRYDPNREDLPFAAQAAALYSAYHSQRIFVHRPFLTMPRTAMPFPSLAICTNAARACIQVLDRYFALSGPVLLYHYHVGTIFQAGIMMLLHVWLSMRNGATGDSTPEFTLVRTSLKMLRALENHWDVAGRYWDILYDALSAVEARQHRIRGASADTGAYLGSVQVQHPDSRRGSLYSVHSAHASTSSLAPTSFGSSPSVGMVSGATAHGNPLDFEAHPWDSSAAGAAAPQQYYSVRNGDPGFDAIFADLVPMVPYDGSFGGIQHGLEITQQFDHGASGSGAQQYGGFVPTWGSGSGPTGG
ncbi:Zn(II)2Cys6 transcription factor [Phanerochaete sordida]|uniref:Zn(II)2Cys6 transcription factor n=1 Tax=Phanerochaete sordida TaxID=48140 RepID=A0A9P3G5V5_9APHY|nr:Zn(II)2Cys6 transcription factor [Phanerochaete sordida]